MSWASQVNEQLEELKIDENVKPMGGIGRGRIVSTTETPGVQNGVAAHGTGKSPSSFSFKLNTNDTTAKQDNQNKTSFGADFGNAPKSPGFGGGSGFGKPFGSLSANSNFGAASTFGNLSESKRSSSAVKVSQQPPRAASENWDAADDEKPASREEESRLNKLVHDKLVQIKELNINVKNCSRKDLHPNSPLFSLKTFEELRLRKELLEGVSSMGFSYPSKIQEATLPVLLADPPQNIIAQSQSGTGKTAAFVLTMLSRVDSSIQEPQCLCLAPTYELALQIGQIVETMGRYCPDIKVTYAVRGARVISRGDQIKEHIIIGTPGTSLDWMLKLRCFDPKRIRVFVLDEADIMISQQGHQDQSIRMHKALSPDCQRLFFSATYEDDVIEFAGKIVSDPIIYTVRKEELPLENVKQYYVECASKEDKFKALSNIYGGLTIGQSMIFCHTKKMANWLASEMSQDGHSVALLSSELDINQRAAVIKRFKDAQERCLICTNVCARGIDVEQVTVVINFDLPLNLNRTPDYETYLHRIGRTGRFGKNGLAINFIDGSQSRAILQDIEKYFDMKVEKLDTSDMEALELIEKIS